MLWKPQVKVPFGERRMSIWCLSTESEDLSGRVSVNAAFERRGSSDNTGRMEKKGAMAGVWADGWADERLLLKLSCVCPTALNSSLLWCPQACRARVQDDHSDIQLLIMFSTVILDLGASEELYFSGCA